MVSCRLECEHSALVAGGGEETRQAEDTGGQDEEKTLRQQRARLEARMAILEDHNRFISCPAILQTI